MKKIIFLFIALLGVCFVYGQDITDAVRYSNDEVKGTARFRAMGGAFGALGGDLSAVNINPASSAVFTQSRASFTTGFNSISNNSEYFGSSLSDTDSNINFYQGGGVFVYASNNPKTKWKKFSLGVAYDQIENYSDSWGVSSLDASTSISEYFLGYSQGLRLDEISAFPGESLSDAYADIGSAYGYANQQAFLGYESLVIDPIDNSDDNTDYVSSILGDRFNQNYFFESVGYNGKMAINFAGQYDNKLNLGLNINAHFINYERLTLMNEINFNPNSAVERVNFENRLRTTGAGFSFQIGSIYNITKELRAGLSYQSPTWYRITDETSQFIETLVSQGNAFREIYPGIINIFPEYKLRTPAKLTGSLAYVFSDKGLFSFDYSRKDFSEAIFRPTDDPFFAFQNTEIQNLLSVSNTYRFGAEYRYNQFSFRGGYRFEESPYTDDSILGDYRVYSLGLGYKIGDFAIDLAFVHGQRDQNNLLYSDAPTFRESAQIDSKLTDILLSLSFGI
ncbi:outer membrane protein transport protein [Winogradskyella sp.]|nr:outer membrane protein transport protein [Winogradskyella sp.]